MAGGSDIRGDQNEMDGNKGIRSCFFFGGGGGGGREENEQGEKKEKWNDKKCPADTYTSIALPFCL